MEESIIGKDVSKRQQIIDILLKFQHDLDTEKMKTSDIQEWCQEINYLLREMFMEIGDVFDMIFERLNQTEDLEESPQKDYGGFYS